MIGFNTISVKTKALLMLISPVKTNAIVNVVKVPTTL